MKVHFADSHLFAVSSQGRRGKGAFSDFFYKDTNSIDGALPSRPNYIPKAPPPNDIILGIRFSIYEFEGDADIQAKASSMTWNIFFITYYTLGFFSHSLSHK